MPKKLSEPTYQLHKGSGQARTIIDGKSLSWPAQQRRVARAI